jgi:hypothetical protein
VRGLPVLIPYVALSGYRRPGLREAALAAVNFRHKKTPHSGEALFSVNP